MKEFHYRITLEPLDQEASGGQTLVFEAANHDDILKIIELARQTPSIGDSAESFVLGLKLFSDVCLKRRNEPLFADLKPHLTEVIKRIKSDIRKANAQPAEQAAPIPPDAS